MVGKTMPNEAEPGTIRGDLGVSGLRNLIHASDAPETAEAELALWFGADALVDYGARSTPGSSPRSRREPEAQLSPAASGGYSGRSMSPIRSSGK